MLKSITAIAAAAAIAAAISILTAPGGELSAGPAGEIRRNRPQCLRTAAWPYFNCVGTRLGNQRIRLVTTDRLAGD
jgi:hypothetical protein